MIKIYTDGSQWDIRERPSWCQTTKDDDSFLITCSRNDGVGRSGYIKLEASKRPRIVNVFQEGKVRGEITNVKAEDAIGGNVRGLRVFVDFFVHDMQGLSGRCVASI